MGFFDRIGAGWTLGKQALGVAWNDKSLMLFPAISGLASLAVIAGYYFGVGPEKIGKLIESVQSGGGLNGVNDWASVAITFILYFGLYFITIYFNVALIGAANLSIDGKDTTLGDGIQTANAHLGSILAWAAISGTVGLILSLIENDRRAGRFIRSILGTVWSIITYFVLPVMIFEKTTAFEAIGRSTKIMRSSWGESAGAQFSIGWWFFLLNLPAIALILLAVAGGGALAPVLIPIAVLYIAFITLLQQTAKSILMVAIYRYAIDRSSPSEFDGQAISSAFG